MTEINEEITNLRNESIEALKSRCYDLSEELENIQRAADGVFAKLKVIRSVIVEKRTETETATEKPLEAVK